MTSHTAFKLNSLPLCLGRNEEHIMGLLNTRSLAATVAALLLCTARESRGSNGYLSQIGPPPLRFSLATASLSFILPPSLINVPLPTNTTKIASSPTPTAGTNSTPGFTGPKMASTSVFTTSTSPDPSENAPQPTPAASDMLVVSPQMLTEYFKPDPNGPNSGGVLVPVPVGFTPPTVKPSSQATYRSP